MSAATAEPGQAAEQPSEKGTQISKVWVPVILILAVLLGLALAETIPSPVCPPWISVPVPGHTSTCYQSMGRSCCM